MPSTKSNQPRSRPSKSHLNRKIKHITHKMKEKFLKNLTKEETKILKDKSTEIPFTGKFLKNKKQGIYTCKACCQELFKSNTKYNSHSGWPSFYDVIKKGNIKLIKDTTLGIQRIEVQCSKCLGHLGHLFEDGPQEETGKRYCINSLSLNFKEKK